MRNRNAIFVNCLFAFVRLILEFYFYYNANKRKLNEQRIAKRQKTKVKLFLSFTPFSSSFLVFFSFYCIVLFYSNKENKSNKKQTKRKRTREAHTATLFLLSCALCFCYFPHLSAIKLQIHKQESKIASGRV